MGTEKEAALPIEAFGGINRNIEGEDIETSQLYSAQNLWERKLGTYETRGGSSVTVDDTSLPSNITGIDNLFKLYKSNGQNVRYCAIKCDEDYTESIGSLPAGVALSLVNDPSGYWSNNTITLYGVNYSNDHESLTLRFVGYGTDIFYTIPYASISGYNNAQKQRLVISVTQAQNSNITGIEIMAKVKCGRVQPTAAITDTSTYNSRNIWVGFVDLVSSPTGTFNFLYSPVGYKTGIAVPSNIGSTERSFNITAFANDGVVNTTGNLPAGTTYYVAVLPQYSVFDSNPNSRLQYRQPFANTNTNDIAVVTIPTSSPTGGIRITNINPNTQCYLVAIGETPQTLVPAFIMNDSESGVGLAPEIIEFPKNSPAVLNTTYTSATAKTLAFTASEFSRKDMFLGVRDGGTIFPIFAANVSATSSADIYYDYFGLPAYGVNTRFYQIGRANFPNEFPALGNGSKYNFIQWQNYSLVVNDYNPTNVIYGHPYYPPRSYSNYWLNDGLVAVPVIPDYQANPITLPPMKYIQKFKGSVVLGGGQATNDPVTGASNSSSQTMYFSRAENPFDFTIPGATSTTYQTVAFFDDPEVINGFAIYSATSTNDGPFTQLIISKKNAILVMNDLPDVTSGALNNATVQYVSKKVGSVGHRTFVNTPVGTLFASVDNVYLMRESGEPTPVGQDLHDLMIDSRFDMACACYHDRHYKLSFNNASYSPTFGGQNNVEVWLNINKMVERKGAAEWVGPMVGRGINYTFVEDQDGDGLNYGIASSRYCTGYYGNRIFAMFRTDLSPGANDTTIFDFSTPVEVQIITKDYPFSQQDANWNKLVKRWYWKIRTNEDTTGITLSEQTYINGILADDQTFDVVAAIPSAGWEDQPYQLVRIFPLTRIRGRTMKKILTCSRRVAISALQLNYEVEKRRI